MIERIEFKGFYIEACGLEGESKAEEVVPAQQNTIRLSRERWLIVYETRGFRGVDDNRSVVYQVRSGSPDGPVLAENFLERALQDWDPFGKGDRYVMECNHVVAFGVPEGARIKGKPVPYAGVFAALWRRNARVLDQRENYLLQQTEAALPGETFRCRWVQFRLNETKDDIEILSPVSELRQKGYEKGVAVCAHESIGKMGQSFVNPVPFKEDGSEWAFVVHFDECWCCPIKFRWDPDRRLYAWTECGPRLEGPKELRVWESALAPYCGEWLIASRILPRTYGNVWFRMKDPFGPPVKGFLSEAIGSNCPRTMYAFPDGIIRVMTTDQIGTPYRLHQPRIPLHIMDIDPDNDFAVTNTEVLFDSIKEGLPLSMENAPSLHFGRLIPHAGGRTGYLNYFVRPRAIKNRARAAGFYKGIVKPEEIRASGAYYSKITYDRDYPGQWNFGD